MSEQTSDGLTVVRPTPAARLRMWLPGVIAAPFIVLVGLIELFTAPGLTVVFVVLAAVIFVVTVAQARILRVELGAGQYRYRSLVRRRDFAAADVVAAHTFTSLRQSLYTFADLMVEGKDGRRLMRLPSLAWDVSLLTFVAQDLAANGVHLVVTDVPVTAAQVRAAHPRLVSWFEAHQLLAAALVGVGALVVAIALVVVVVAISISPVIT